jgi:AraC-like DNA-binding protein
MSVKFYRDSDLPFFELKLCNTAELCYKYHTHEEFSLGIVDRGASSFWYEGHITKLGPKTLVFIPPEIIHACNPLEHGNWQYKMLFIDAKWVRKLTESGGSCLFDQPIIRYASRGKEFQKIDQVINSLTGDSSPLAKETAILMAFEQFFRAEYGSNTLDSRAEKPRLKITREYLQQYFGEKVTLDQLEQVSGLNKFHLIRLFKAAFNVPPHAYQTLLRVNYAKRELRKAREIAEVALEAGFYDQSHFIKVFKSHTGVTPEKYQRL